MTEPAEPDRRPSPWRDARAWAIAAVLTLLAVVGAAAAVLSFSAIRDLAQACGFDPELAWLLPITIDAGAAAGTVVWLARTLAPDDARRFARALALSLLSLSVIANSAGHYLTAEQVAPPWWLIVAVSAIAPATLGAVVHLAVLARRAPDADVPAHTVPAHARVNAPAYVLASAGAPDDVEDEGTDGDGYSAAVRAQAAQLGITLEPAPSGEDRRARRKRLSKERNRVRRAATAARAAHPSSGDPETALVRTGNGRPDGWQ